MERLNELEGIHAMDWTYEYHNAMDLEDYEVIYVYGHREFEHVELEVSTLGGYCVYVRWMKGNDANEMCFGTPEEAIRFSISQGIDPLEGR